MIGRNESEGLIVSLKELIVISLESDYIGSCIDCNQRNGIIFVGSHHFLLDLSQFLIKLVSR